MTTTLNLFCSNRPRPQMHSGRKGGNQWWARDVFHATAPGGKTMLCGLVGDGWLHIGKRAEAETLEDGNFCRRCAAKLKH